MEPPRHRAGCDPLRGVRAACLLPAPGLASIGQTLATLLSHSGRLQAGAPVLGSAKSHQRLRGSSAEAGSPRPEKGACGSQVPDADRMPYGSGHGSMRLVVIHSFTALWDLALVDAAPGTWSGDLSETLSDSGIRQLATAEDGRFDDSVTSRVLPQQGILLRHAGEPRRPGRCADRRASPR